MSKSNRFPVKRIAIDAVLIALYFGLSWAAVEIGGVKLTFVGLASIIAAMVYGPLDGFLVGLLGAFCEQMLKYGFTATTLLWLLGPAMRGLVVGCAKLIFKQSMSTEKLLKNRRPFVFFAVSIFAGLVVSTLNTAAFYVDAKLFHYYTYELIFGVFWLRLLLGAASSLAMALVTLPILAGVQQVNFSLKKVIRL